MDTNIIQCIPSGLSKLDLEHLPRWDTPSFSRQHFPVSYHTHHSEILSYVPSVFILFQLKTLAPCPITAGLEKTFLFNFFIPPLYISKAAIRFPPSLLFSCLKNLNSLQPFCVEGAMHTCDQYCSSCLGVLMGPTLN